MKKDLLVSNRRALAHLSLGTLKKKRRVCLQNVALAVLKNMRPRISVVGFRSKKNILRCGRGGSGRVCLPLAFVLEASPLSRRLKRPLWVVLSCRDSTRRPSSARKGATKSAVFGRVAMGIRAGGIDEGADGVTNFYPANFHTPAEWVGSASCLITSVAVSSLPPPDRIHENEMHDHDANDDECSQGHVCLQFSFRVLQFLFHVVGS